MAESKAGSKTESKPLSCAPESAVVVDRAALASLPVSRASTDVATSWPSEEAQGDLDELDGDFDVCLLRRQPITSLSQLASALENEELQDVDGAFQWAKKGQDRTLTLARDAIGHRTLFYSIQPDGHIVYAANIQAIVQAGVAPRLDPRGLAAYLSCAYIPGRGTLFAEIKELLPGHVLRGRGLPAGNVTYEEQPYFALPAEHGVEDFWDSRSDGQAQSLLPDEEQAVQALRSLLESTVRDGISEERMAASLSGGIDSSAIVALVARELRQRGREKLHTFSIAFGSEYKNELEWSSRVAQHTGTQHTVVHLTPEAIVECLDETHARLASPIGDPLTVPNAILFRKAREVSRFVWNGEGGDPCFGGPKNLPMVLAELYGDGENLDDVRSPRARSYYRAHLKCFDELDGLLTKQAQAAIVEDPLEREVEPYFSKERSFVGALSAINVTWKGGHHILPKVYQLAQAVGILPRSPLFSKSVVELATRLPPSMKLRGSVEKFALKQACRDLLPPDVIDRPKSGMMVPVEGWFQGPLLPYARERLLGGALPFDLIQKSAVEALVDGKVRGLRPRRGVKIWLLVALESYLRQFLGLCKLQPISTRELPRRRGT